MVRLITLIFSMNSTTRWGRSSVSNWRIIMRILFTHISWAQTKASQHLSLPNGMGPNTKLYQCKAAILQNWDRIAVNYFVLINPSIFNSTSLDHSIGRVLEMFSMETGGNILVLIQMYKALGWISPYCYPKLVSERSVGIELVTTHMWLLLHISYTS